MSNPYFSVGEEVALVSNQSPQLNGDYIVERVFLDGEVVFRGEKTDYTNKGGHPVYHLEGEAHDNADGYRTSWAESALRKKHKPSTDSFTEMMSNIDELVTL